MVRRQLCVSSDASHVVNSVQEDSDTANDYFLTEPEIGCELSGSSDQSVEAGCYCIVSVYSNYGKFKMLVQLVLRYLMMVMTLMLNF